MQKQSKLKKVKRIKKIKYPQEEFYVDEIPRKDKDCIDNILEKSILENSDKTLTAKTNVSS